MSEEISFAIQDISCFVGVFEILHQVDSGSTVTLHFLPTGILIEEKISNTCTARFEVYADEMLRYDYNVFDEEENLVPIYYVRVKTADIFKTLKGKKPTLEISIPINTEHGIKKAEIIKIQTLVDGYPTEHTVPVINEDFEVFQSINYYEEFYNNTKPECKVVVEYFSKEVIQACESRGASTITFVCNEGIMRAESLSKSGSSINTSLSQYPDDVPDDNPYKIEVPIHSKTKNWMKNFSKLSGSNTALLKLFMRRTEDRNLPLVIVVNLGLFGNCVFTFGL